MPSKPKQPKNLVPYVCSTLPYQYQEITNIMGTIISVDHPTYISIYNGKFYIGWHSSHTARPK
jgi:hypothetical protein